MHYKDRNFKFYVMLILLIVLFESIAQYHIKKSKAKHGMLFLAIGILSYSIVCLLLKKCYDFDGMGMTNFVWSVLSIVSMLTVGHIMFGEQLKLIDVIGIILSIAGLYLIFVYGHDS